MQRFQHSYTAQIMGEGERNAIIEARMSYMVNTLREGGDRDRV